MKDIRAAQFAAELHEHGITSLEDITDVANLRARGILQKIEHYREFNQDAMRRAVARRPLLGEILGDCFKAVSHE